MPVPKPEHRTHTVKTYMTKTEKIMANKTRKKHNFASWSSFLRFAILNFGTNLGTKNQPIVRKTDIEKKMVVNADARNFSEVMAELKSGFELKPVGAFDNEIRFIEVEE